jgi:hypothetical protein
VPAQTHTTPVSTSGLTAFPQRRRKPCAG